MMMCDDPIVEETRRVRTSRRCGRRMWRYRLNENIITIPFRKPYVLPVYVKNVIALLDALAIASGED